MNRGKMRLKKIYVIGSANTDMVVKTDKLPLPGETKLGGHFFMNAGGKGANQAVTVSRLGGDITFIAKVGNDIFGKQTVTGLKRENVNTDFVFIDKQEPSGIALIMVNEEGENSIVVSPGANSKLLPRDIDSVKNISEAEIILMQLEIPMETVAAVVKMANINNQRVILNPAPAQKLADELLNGLFLITPNETETFFLTGITVEDEATAAQAADGLLNKGVQNIVITLGASGAYIHSGSISKIVPVKPVKATDTTAAGDVFNGALAIAISEGKDLEEAVIFANKAARISVTRMGAQTSVPYRNEINN